jgi:hypothetical protein
VRAQLVGQDDDGAPEATTWDLTALDELPRGFFRTADETGNVGEAEGNLLHEVFSCFDEVGGDGADGQ